ncbi:hypothetical protein [Pontibacillus salipaludis]|uniref:Uncharacterized protein n=1 Tax=Pontibacillus salipaludis TaxID=1697394 RepID=A0ABQ1Q4P2_9BACI|nr:hypothetical protein [Pontibacillus salipaludis]GGD12752.1 hypothetical protein GCM10011389_20390 [Pontibacillus salipaludis]
MNITKKGTYTFNDLKGFSGVEISGEDQVRVNGVTIFNIDAVHIHLIDMDSIQFRFLLGAEEKASFSIEEFESVFVNGHIFLVNTH